MTSDDAILRVAAIQPPLRPDTACPLEAANYVLRMMRKAAEETPSGLDLFVLPELCPMGYSEHSFQNYLSDAKSDKVHREIMGLFRSFAVENGAFVCLGTVGKLEDGRLTIRQVVFSGDGDEIAAYDKINLCDYGDCAETRFFSRGSQSCSFQCGSFRIGIIICADMRYPLLSRELAVEHGVDVIIQPAAFSRDVSFRTWKSFRETRAVENSVYFVGINYAGENFGDTSFQEPWIDGASEPLTMGTHEGVLIGEVKRSVLDHARTSMPFHREMQREAASLRRQGD
eukprot:TRINITY_DN43983_c0_g1_i1.p1 TRINITY_DN43983_c0_g1~~TRINITY_DN43983_c0_g1_i1.p1  ORF type:complete len:298 (+),score=26.52 TRINITY_DN43983_c0_g1_i1:41-895(+)